ncbi:Niemann-Pick C2 protein [Clonorchis sinensis]|uniref:Niemann-Pick C2 protein n=1 Tax=Clonorchis sinensis TaxID=79923 RepID=G7Y3W5_CLOSI|nr:Niemann-Pick C2 protein [Clonorchis sinensis]
MQPFSLLTFSLLSNVLCFTQALEFIDCGSEKALALSVDLTPCDTNPCVLVKGTDITLAITFQSGAFMDAGRSRVQGVYEGRYLPAKYMETDICGHLNPPCPIYGGKKYTYTVSTYVSTGFQSYMETEICGHLNPPCPIYGGKKYTYTVSTYVSTGFQPFTSCSSINDPVLEGVTTPNKANQYLFTTTCQDAPRHKKSAWQRMTHSQGQQWYHTLSDSSSTKEYDITFDVLLDAFELLRRIIRSTEDDPEYSPAVTCEAKRPHAMVRPVDLELRPMKSPLRHDIS